MGLVSDAFDETTLRELAGDVAVGHTRYSTAGSTVLANAQPYLVNYHAGPLSVAHNGNLTNATEIRDALVRQGALFASTSDTEVLVHLIARSGAPTVEGQIRDALEQVDGAYSLVISVGRAIYATVDARGFRPLLIGRVGTGFVVASETCALDLVGATAVRELQPGEFVRIDAGTITDLPRLTPRRVSRCIFELVYFSRPDSTIFGESVDHVRRELGRQLARFHPAPERRRGFFGTGQFQRDGAGLQRSVRNQAGARTDPQSLRGSHLHQSEPGAAGREGQDQVQSGARRHRRAIGRGHRRFARARHDESRDSSR